MKIHSMPMVAVLVAALALAALSPAPTIGRGSLDHDEIAVSPDNFGATQWATGYAADADA